MLSPWLVACTPAPICAGEHSDTVQPQVWAVVVAAADEDVVLAGILHPSRAHEVDPLIEPALLATYRL